MSDHLKKAKTIIAEQLGLDLDHVTPEARLIDDLGADSLDTVELIMAFEEEYGIEIDDTEAEKCKTVADIIAYLERVAP